MPISARRDVAAAAAAAARAHVRGSPLRVFDSYSQADGDGDESEEDEEERLLYFLMANEFFAGRTCTLTPDRALAGVKVQNMRRNVKEPCTSPARKALFEARGISQLPSRSELLDVSSSDSDDEVLPPPPRPAAPAVDDRWATRRWQPTPSEEQVLAAAERLLLAEALRFRREASLRQGLRGLAAGVMAAMERLSWRRHGRHRVFSEAWGAWRGDSVRTAHAASVCHTLRASRLAKGLLAWRNTWRRQAQQRLLLLADTFRRMWVHTHTQRLARCLVCDEEGEDDE